MATEDPASPPADDTPVAVYSFVLKVFLERSRSGGPVVWHGWIAQAPDGERRYINSVAGLSRIIAGFLSANGVRLDWRSRLCGRLTGRPAGGSRTPGERAEY